MNGWEGGKVLSTVTSRKGKIELTYDRIMDITDFKSLTNTNASNQKITYGEFLNRMIEPTITGKKGKAGGFIGGYVKNSRNNENVKSRSMVTIDIDEVPQGIHVWENIAGFTNFAVAMYSTHNHTKDDPRYRIIIPLLDDIEPEHYKEVTQYIVGIFQVEIDETSYEFARHMHYPTCSDIDNYEFYYQDLPFFDASFITKQKEEIQTFKKNEKADPRKKQNWIGAWTNIYAVTDVLNHFLSDTYELFRNNRYTYLGGSTKGGLVVYDGDVHAHSNHSTDPISGKNVNSFDLYRLHTFGHLDNGAEDTTNKPSYKAMIEHCKKDEKVREYYEKHISAGQGIRKQEEPKVQNEIDFKRNSKNKILVKAENTKKLLDAMGIEVYYDVIRKREYVSSFQLYFDGEIADHHAQGMIEEAMDRGYFITKDKLIDHLLYLASCNKKNKVAEYFLKVSKKWDGNSRIEKVFDTLHAKSDRELGIVYLKKWAIQAVKLACNESGKMNQEFVLVFQGSQGCGKTFWFRLLFSSLGDDYFKTGKRLNPENKDSVMEAISNFAVELGELDSTMKFEQAALKAFFTENFDEFRRPYQRLSVKYPRMTVFFATVNDDEFLKDKTGNRRYAVINVGDKISDLKTMDIDQFWGEIATMALKDDAHLLTSEEARKQKEHNEESELQTHEEIEILSGFSWGTSKDLWTWKSSKVIFKELDLTKSTKNAAIALKNLSGIYDIICTKKD
ncbi:VapE domain-containing protein, partial [Bacillus toyonensis]